MDIFYNPDTQRLRAGWRLLLQFTMMLTLLFGAQFLLQWAVSSPGFLLNRIPSTIAFVLSTWLAVRYLDGRTFWSLGISIDRTWFREICAGFAMGGVVMALIFLSQLLMGWIDFTGYGWERAGSDLYPLPVLASLVGMLLVGFYEELVFRGYQITNLVEGFSTPQGHPRRAVAWAVLLSSALFGVMHAGNPNASIISTINIVLAGPVLALPYLVTGSLALSVGLHASWNFFQGAVFGFPVSGRALGGALLQVQESGPDLFTGGRFGPEAGLVGILGLLVIVGLVWQYTKYAGYSFSIHNNFRGNNR